ncbi:unnamed protein product [Rotaria sp. Silwood1]|nr:unnamed protein product [Rotaria sp. Silwood1]CAF1638206.1 unnamed protein product [Rotaria sp. Silwood1]
MHPSSSEYAANFRSPNFNRISIAKIIAVRIILELGYNVLFSDADIAWMQNPVLFLPTDVDLAIQSNTETHLFPLGHEANTGFYFLKSNNRSMALLDETIERSKKNTNIDDQTHFADALRDWRKANKAVFIMEGETVPCVYNGSQPFTFRLLHPYQFQNGKAAMAFFANKLQPPNDGKQRDVVLVHANYMSGHNAKVNFLKSHKLWNINDTTFQRYVDEWNLKKEKYTGEQNQPRYIDYKSALKELAYVCVA